MASTRATPGWFSCLAFALVAPVFVPAAAAARPVLHPTPLVLLPMDGSFSLVSSTAPLVGQPSIQPPPTARQLTAPAALPRAITLSLDLIAARRAFEGPIWTLQPRARGPVLELAALGAGQDWAPGLVHASVDWQF